MPTIGWDETVPSDGESAGLGDDRIRSLKTSVRVGLDSEHVWPAGGGDAGVHRPGSARPYFGVQSAVSSAGTDGKTMWASDTSNYFHVGSGGTSFIGGPQTLSVGSYPATVPQRHHWVIETGETKLNALGQVVVNYPNSGFSGIPFTTVTGWNADAITYFFGTIAGRSATSFTVSFVDHSGAPASSQSFYWMSIGTRVL